MLEALRARAQELAAEPDPDETELARLREERARQLADLPRRRLEALSRRASGIGLSHAPEVEPIAQPLLVELVPTGPDDADQPLREAVRKRIDAGYPRDHRGKDRDLTQNAIAKRTQRSKRQVRKMEQKLDPDWETHNRRPSR